MPFVWPPKKRDIEITIIIPSSNITILPDLRSKTEFAGMLARIIATYKVNNIVIFRDKDSSIEDANFLKLILDYLLIPPYLRKRLVPIIPELKFAGVLPPLNIVTHNPEGLKPRKGDLREGLVVTSYGVKAKVFIGYSKYCFTQSRRELNVNERVLVRVINEEPLRCEVEDANSVSEYIGYRTHIALSERELLDILKNLQGISILTSKDGDDYIKVPLRKALVKSIRESGGALIFFGNHSKDFNELVNRRFLDEIGIRFKINFIPGQGVVSIRTLEALIATLSLLNADIETYST
ncbi:MAG: hypothetical protein B6U85_04055 [Desulfurococcales archaeon ex4484_42]|nr:MAG: hypothetical protein B6U85_04055 [Desulfurococcales archaeon ex4484_42]